MSGKVLKEIGDLLARVMTWPADQRDAFIEDALDLVRRMAADRALAEVSDAPGWQAGNLIVDSAKGAKDNGR